MAIMMMWCVMANNDDVMALPLPAKYNYRMDGAGGILDSHTIRAKTALGTHFFVGTMSYQLS
jgi:hypothetical protein